jgi:hypothetical protein
MVGCPRALGWAPVPRSAGAAGSGGGWGQTGCRAWRRSQALVRSVDHGQPGGIFRIRCLVWVTRWAGAERIGW